MANELSATDKSALKKYEGKILRSARNVGEALRAIKAKKLYRGYGTFEEYCSQRWNYTPQHVNRLIAFEDTLDVLKSEPKCSLLPATEQQSRPLNKLPKDSRAQAFAAAIDAANGGQPTANQVAKAVEDLEIPESEPKSPLQEAYDRHKPTRDISARIHEIVRAFEALEDAHPHISRQSVTNHLRAAMAEIRMGQPYALCAYCAGKKCRTCKESGYLNRTLHDQAPKEMQSKVPRRGVAGCG